MSSRYEASFDDDHASFDERLTVPAVHLTSHPPISDLLTTPLTQYQGASDFYRNVFLPFIVSTQEHFNKPVTAATSPDKRHTVYSASKGR